MTSSTQPDDERFRLDLEMVRRSDPPSGSIGEQGGNLHPFIGWTGLAQQIEAFVDHEEKQ